MADNLQINVNSSQRTPVVMEEKKLVLKILSSVAGAKGDSIYTLAVKHGYTGTEEEFVETYMRSVVDNVYDISASHLVEGQPSEYTNLAAALGIDGANIPSDLQLGGMSVKFIESTGHTYVQYRLMKNQFSTNGSDWQGIDTEPTSGSENLVKSGGVFKLASYRGTLISNSEVNNPLLAKGLWYSLSNNTYIPTANHAFVLVKGTVNLVTQICFDLVNGDIFSRISIIQSGTFQGWSDWKKLLTSFFLYKGNIPASTDLNVFQSEGYFYLNNSFNISNLPDLPTTYICILSNFGTGTIRQQELINLNTNTKYYRSNNGQGWSDWSVTVKTQDLENLKTSIESELESELNNLYLNRPISASEVLNQLISSTGTIVSSTLATNYYDVTPGQKYKVSYQNFSSLGYAVISWWNSDTFVSAALVTPVIAGSKTVTVPDGVNKMAVSLATDCIRLDLITPAFDSLEQEVSGMSDNVTLLSDNLIGFDLISGIEKTGIPTTTGTISTQLKRYEYSVVSGDNIRVIVGSFSSSGYSVVSLWNDDTFIKSLVNSPTSGTSTYDVVIPTGCNKLVVSYLQNNVYKKTISYKIGNTNYWLGKKMVAIGDSLVAGKNAGSTHGTFIEEIGRNLGLSEVVNLGIGGCRLANVGDAQVGAECSVVARLTDTNNTYTYKGVTYTYQDTINQFNNADIILVHAGTNDWASQVVLGSNDTRYNNTTFWGALFQICQKLRSLCPKALIILDTIADRVYYNATEVPVSGGTESRPILTSQYSELIDTLAKVSKFICYDTYRLWGLDMTFDYSLHNYTVDGLHLNPEGAKIVGRKMASFIRCN